MKFSVPIQMCSIAIVADQKHLHFHHLLQLTPEDVGGEVVGVFVGAELFGAGVGGLVG